MYTTLNFVWKIMQPISVVSYFMIISPMELWKVFAYKLIVWHSQSLNDNSIITSPIIIITALCIVDLVPSLLPISAMTFTSGSARYI